MTLRFRALVASLAIAGCASIPLVGREAPAYWAFTAPWDPRSDSSARKHATDLNAVVYGWFGLDTLTGLPTQLFTDNLSPLAPSGTSRMAIVTNSAAGTFRPNVIRGLAANDQALRRSSLEIAGRAATRGYRGLVLDFEALSPPDLPALLKVVQAIADAARSRGVGPVIVAIPATDTVGYPAAPFFPVADFVLVMLYDEHWATSPPGPVSSPGWARRWLAKRVSEVGPSRVVAALPLYGYAWPSGTGTSTASATTETARGGPGAAARAVSFAEAQGLAAAMGVELTREPASQTLHAERAGNWDIWVSDAGLLRALSDECAGLGVSRIALWRLGLEDPRVWDLVASRR